MVNMNATAVDINGGFFPCVYIVGLSALHSVVAFAD